MGVQGIALTLLVACAIAADPCDSTAPPEPGPAPSPTPAPPNPCDTTPSPAPAPTPAPTPGCDDKPADWKSTAGSTCADYVSKAWCTSDGGYGSGWDKSTWGTFDTWAVHGAAATVACCGCGGGSTVTGKQACQGHSYDKATCEAVGCCRWNVLLGCRANDGDALCYSGNPCDTTVSPGPSPPGPGKKAVIGGVIAGAAGLAVAGGIMAKSTTTAAPGPVTTTSVTQGAQTNPPPTTTTKNSSSDLLWLWILLGILALCCLLSLCGGGLAACMGGKKKKKKSKRATRVSQPSPEPVLLPVVEEQQELLPMVPPLMEPYPMTSMAAPTMVETVQMVPTATPTMVETAVPMMQAPMSMMGAPAMQEVGGFGAQALPAMGGGGFGTQAMPGIL